MQCYIYAKCGRRFINIGDGRDTSGFNPWRNCSYISNDDRIGAMNIQLLGTVYISGQEQPKFELTTNTFTY